MAIDRENDLIKYAESIADVFHHTRFTTDTDALLHGILKTQISIARMMYNTQPDSEDKAQQTSASCIIDMDSVIAVEDVELCDGVLNCKRSFVHSRHRWYIAKAGPRDTPKVVSHTPIYVCLGDIAR
jgi:hypothetical protein